MTSNASDDTECHANFLMGNADLATAILRIDIALVPHRSGACEASVCLQWLTYRCLMWQTRPQIQTERDLRQTSSAPTTAIALNHKNDQLAMDPPKKVQSTLVQSPLPLKIMGMARCNGKVSIMP